MKSKKNILLLIGSPKNKRSTSYSLGNFLLKHVSDDIFNKEIIFVHHIYKSTEKTEKLIQKINKLSLIILAYPLYVDCLPAPVIKLMQKIKSKPVNNVVKPKLLIIINNGFPEEIQNNTAIKICHQFASESGIDWYGSLSLGSGGLIGGLPLEKRKGMASKIIESLKITANAINQNESLPEKATELMSISMMPKRLYTTMGNFGWKIQARKYGAQKKLNAKPFQID